jgi:4-amino-4-deoxy-L-arabinose transferase-like glycosyltransferase
VRPGVIVAVGAVTAAGFALRLAWVLTVEPPFGGFSDYQWYFATAQNLAGGLGMTVVAVPDVGFFPGRGGYQATFWAPGYSLTLAAFFKLFGASWTTGEIVNVVASTALIPLAFLIGRRIHGVAAGIIASALLAFYPVHIYYSAVLISDVMFALVVAAVIVVVVYAPAPPRGVMVPALLGALVGYGALLRPQGLVLAVVIAVYWFVASNRRREVLVPSILFACAAAVFIVPISAWNSARTDELHFLSTNAGENLRVGHAPWSSGRSIRPRDDDGKIAPAQLDYRPASNNVRNATTYVVQHPLRELDLSARKVWYLYAPDTASLLWVTGAGQSAIWGSSDATQSLIDIARVSGFLLIILALAGAPFCFSRGGPCLFLWLLLGAWTGVHVVFYGEPRYSLPLSPILVTFAAVAAVKAWWLVLSMSDSEPTGAKTPTPDKSG